MIKSDSMEARALLHTKMNNIRAEISHIEKGGENTLQHYKYATEADVAHAIRNAMIKHGISLVFSSVFDSERAIEGRNGPIPVLRVKLTGAWVDCSTGFAENFMFDGEGMDSGDKAIYKAHTGAEKYLLLKTFLVPTGDDPEKDNKDEKDILEGGVDKKRAERDKLSLSAEQTIAVLEHIAEINSLPHLDNFKKILKGESKVKGANNDKFWNIASKLTAEDLQEIKTRFDAREQKIRDSLSNTVDKKADLLEIAKLKGKAEADLINECRVNFNHTKTDLSKLTPDEAEALGDWLHSLPNK